MAGWKKILGGIVNNVESHFDKLKNEFDERLDRRDGMHIIPYRGYGTRQHVILRGRLLEEHTVSLSEENDSVWRNLLNMYQRFESDEIPYAPLKATLAGETFEFETDHEGYFHADITLSEPLPGDAATFQAYIEHRDDSSVNVEATVMVPAPDAEFGVISDIDDTVMRTNVTNLLKLARNTFLRNAHTRLPFPGVAALYRALESGTDTTHNPIFYVSNSPWNLHDLLHDFFKLRHLPDGPLFLRDVGLTDRYIGADPQHKADSVRHLLELYPQMNVILIGDSGEKDAAIYRDVVADMPERVLAVYIRDVDPHNTDSKRDKKVNAIANEVTEKYGVPMLLVQHSLAAAEHAHSQGWITADELQAVREEQQQDLEQSDLESMLDSVAEDDTVDEDNNTDNTGTGEGK
jgi:phosphatidate phosphatase APP1